MHHRPGSTRLLLAFACIGIVAIFSAACNNDSPSSPSALTEVGLPVEPSPDASSANLRSASGLTNGRSNNGRETQSSGQRGDENRRVAYCKNLPTGHEHYARCQTWLNSSRDKEGAAKRNAAAAKKRRVAYCKNLPTGHEHYDRCQTLLNSGNQRRGPRTK